MTYWRSSETAEINGRQIHQEATVDKSWGQKGSPWEFNLRDLFRWCDLLCHNQVKDLYERIFPDSLPFYVPSRQVTISNSVIQAGHSFLCREEFVSRETTRSLYLLHHLLERMEAVMKWGLSPVVRPAWSSYCPV
ncbi:midasin-like isoform X2 [Pecten maximus]|uniref:midasin-like isoform X2 n=1 Tax=Pecten maximus TaxID=6579 RepID=UPI001458F863|nr:midasin-like isoform X2 [Pecten maximus]